MRTLYIARNEHQMRYHFGLRSDAAGSVPGNIFYTSARHIDYGNGDKERWVSASAIRDGIVRGCRFDRVVLLRGTAVAIRDIGHLFSEPGCESIIEAE